MQKGYRDLKPATVHEKTGRTLVEWYRLLDAFDVKTHGHTNAAKWLKEIHHQSAWWSQVLTVKYEYHRQLRQ